MLRESLELVISLVDGVDYELSLPNLCTRSNLLVIRSLGYIFLRRTPSFVGHEGH